MALLANKGKLPDGKTQDFPISGIAAITTTPLGVSGIWDSGVLPYNGATTVDYQIVSDQTGTFKVTYYDADLTTPLNFMPASGTYSPTQGTPSPFPFQSTFNAKGYGIKFTYTNGSVAQTQFLLAIMFGQSSQETQQSTVTPITDTNKALVSKGTMQGKEDATGTRKEITTTTSSSKTGMDVNIINPTAPVSSVSVSNFPATQPVSNASLGSTSDTLVTDPTQSGSIVALLKGLLQESVAQASTGSFTAYTLVANTAQTIAANGNGKGRIITSVSGTILIAVGFTATASNWSYRIVTNGTVEIRPEWGALPVSLFSTAAGNVNVTVMA